MGLDPPPPVHMRPPEPDPLPLRVDVINGWPLKASDDIFILEFPANYEKRLGFVEASFVILCCKLKPVLYASLLRNNQCQAIYVQVLDEQ